MRLYSVFVLLSFFIGCSAPDNVPSAEYVPVVYVAERNVGLVRDKTLLTVEHLDRIEHVLAYYELPFQRKGPELLLITEALSRDLDYLRNMTSKAENLDWLRSHPLSGAEKSRFK